jgi:hypothetical protein
MILFSKMYAVFYTVKIVYICVFRVFIYPAVFVTQLWIYGMYVCMYVCMYYLRMYYVCM